jgi:class 3 adenylate cyclase
LSEPDTPHPPTADLMVSPVRRAWVERLPHWARRLVSIGARPDDDEDERLRKASLVLTASLITTMSVVWVVTYAALGFYLSAAIPFTYQVLTILSLVALARTGRFGFFRTSQLGLILLLPMLLQWTLGGFVVSSGVMLWALIAPLGALVLAPHPMPWFLAYLSLTVISGAIEPILTPVRMPPALVVLFFILNIAGVSTVVYLLLRYFIRGFAAEREKSEMLLLNVMPASIARRLKGGERPLADRFEDAAVLFADIVGFTPMAEGLAPESVVGFLDDLFSEFDTLAELHGLEKIKTVGDAYVVVGGVPEPTPNAPVAIVEMALDMLDLVASRPAPDGGSLSLRIGIDVGPVVAGVIGRQKFTYDLWGDTVNTASRMESHGVAGAIQVTPHAHERLKHLYRFERRGVVEVKGKGSISPWILKGRSSPPRVTRPDPEVGASLI